MAYDDHICPCAGHKKPQTMLCGDCERDLGSTIEFAVWKDRTRTIPQRRNAAIRLISLARKRHAIMAPHRAA